MHSSRLLLSNDFVFHLGTLMSDTKAPVVLPYELERDIFELTTRAYPGVGPKLSFVSRYVQAWYAHSPHIDD